MVFLTAQKGAGHRCVWVTSFPLCQWSEGKKTHVHNYTIPFNTDGWGYPLYDTGQSRRYFVRELVYWIVTRSTAARIVSYPSDWLLIFGRMFKTLPGSCREAVRIPSEDAFKYGTHARRWRLVLTDVWLYSLPKVIDIRDNVFTFRKEGKGECILSDDDSGTATHM